MNYNADILNEGFNRRDWPLTKHPQFHEGIGKWVLARPRDGSYWWERIKPAWRVLTGKLDTLSWTGQ